MEAGKHVYQEKTMAFTLEQAKLMRAACQRAGAQSSRSAISPARQARSRTLRITWPAAASASVTAIRAHMYRNTPHGKPHWTRPVYPDMTPESIDWKAFLGSAPPREFDADRYINWRLFQDYSGGNVHENMSHQLAFWYKVMDLRIPWAVTMTGGIYRWKDGREVPDTMNVSMEHPEHELLFSWDSGFGNNHPGVTEEVLGTDGTIVRGPADPLPAAESESARRRGNAGTDANAAARSYAEFSRLHPPLARDPMPLRNRFSRFGRVPHGDRKLPRWAAPSTGMRQRKKSSECAEPAFASLAAGAAIAGMGWAVRGRSSTVFGPSVWRGRPGRQGRRVDL